MACLIIGDNVNTGDIFVPRQLFVFGSIVLHADATGHLNQIDNFAPVQHIRFGNLEYFADARGDLIFSGFSASPATAMASEVWTSGAIPNPIPGSALATQPASSSEASPMSED